MYRIDTPGSIIVDGKGTWQLATKPATMLGADWPQCLQECLIAIIADAGLDPYANFTEAQGDDFNRIGDAIQVLASNAATGAAETVQGQILVIVNEIITKTGGSAYANFAAGQSDSWGKVGTALNASVAMANAMIIAAGGTVYSTFDAGQTDSWARLAAVITTLESNINGEIARAEAAEAALTEALAALGTPTITASLAVTASGGGSVTTTSKICSYSLIGKMLVLQFYIVGTLSGTVNSISLQTPTTNNETGGGSCWMSQASEKMAAIAVASSTVVFTDPANLPSGIPFSTGDFTLIGSVVVFTN